MCRAACPGLLDSGAQRRREWPMTLPGVTAVLEAQAAQFLRAHVYGSVARGQQEESSDMDLLIYTPEELAELVDERKNAFLADIIAKGVTVEGSQSRGAAVAPAG